jgi:hypothetical protein
MNPGEEEQEERERESVCVCVERERRTTEKRREGQESKGKLGGRKEARTAGRSWGRSQPGHLVRTSALAGPSVGSGRDALSLLVS